MRVIIQRVSRASVEINNRKVAGIGPGMLVLLGIETRDEEADVEWLTGKIARLRIFDDETGVMNLSVTDVKGEILVVSQFTLHASVKKGNRPSYIHSAVPDKAIPLYQSFVSNLQNLTGKPVFTGEFGAEMQVELVNDGPVTIWIDSRNRE